jgi:hypothetical protein
MIDFLNKYITIGPKFDIDYVLDKIIDNTNKHSAKTTFVVNNISYTVKMNSKRYITFKNRIECCICGTKGSYFLLQQNKHDLDSINNNKAHYNLYAEDTYCLNSGKVILMTADHIMPISRGGSNDRSNLITMCFICNNAKGNSI